MLELPSRAMAYYQNTLKPDFSAAAHEFVAGLNVTSATPSATFPFIAAEGAALGLAGLSAGGVLGSGASLASGVFVASVGKKYFNPTRVKAASKNLLNLSLVGLGFGTNFREISHVGVYGVAYTALSIGGCLAVGITLGKAMKMNPTQVYLDSFGAAICGGSAVAFLENLLGLESDEAKRMVSASLAMVFLLNFAGLPISQAIGHHLSMEPTVFARWVALAIHDTASVLGAVDGQSVEVVRLAALMKVIRAMGILPFGLLIREWEKYTRSQNKNLAESAAIKTPPPPPFIKYFLAAALLMTFFPTLRPLGQTLSGGAKHLMGPALVFVGLNSSLGDLKAIGPKPIVHSTMLWLFMGGVTLYAAQNGFLR